MTSFNGLYPEPLYYEIDFNDGVTHLWSREVYHDYFDLGENKDNKIKQTKEQVKLKYWLMDNETINYTAICLSYEESRREKKQKMKDILNSISDPKTIPLFDIDWRID